MHNVFKSKFKKEVNRDIAMAQDILLMNLLATYTIEMIEISSGFTDFVNLF